MMKSDGLNRSKFIGKQIRGAIVYKLLAAIISYLSIPLALEQLGEEEFGVWTILLSIFSWFSLFDLGIGNGLRNSVAENVAKNDYRAIRCAIGNAYGFVGLTVLLLIIFSICFSGQVQWQKLLNVDRIPEEKLLSVVKVSSTLVLLNLWFGLVNSIAYAIQKSSITAIGQLVGGSILYLLLLMDSKVYGKSLVTYAATYGLSMLVGNISVNIWLFLREPKIRPNFDLNFTVARPLLLSGFNFLLIQVAGLVLFTSDKFLIVQLFGTETVAQFEICYRYVSVTSFAFSVLSAPLWSAYTDAYYRGEIYWIWSTIKKHFILFTGFVFITILFALNAKWVIRLWVGDGIQVSNSVIISVSGFVIVSMWNSVFAAVVNGIGVVKLQLWSAIVATVVNIPLSLILSKNFGLGVSGVVLGSTLSLMLPGIVLPLQVGILIRNRKVI